MEIENWRKKIIMQFMILTTTDETLKQLKGTVLINPYP